MYDSLPVPGPQLVVDVLGDEEPNPVPAQRRLVDVFVGDLQGEYICPDNGIIKHQKWAFRVGKIVKLIIFSIFLLKTIIFVPKLLNFIDLGAKEEALLSLSHEVEEGGQTLALAGT